MSDSTKNRLTPVVAAIVAGVALFGVVSPAAASNWNNVAVLTSHSPWLAPKAFRSTAWSASKGIRIRTLGRG